MDDCEWKVKLGLGLHRKGTKRQLTRGLAPCPTDFKPPFTRWWWILSILWKIGFDDYLDENYKRVRMWFPTRLCQKSWHYRQKRVWPILLLGLSSNKWLKSFTNVHLKPNAWILEAPERSTWPLCPDVDDEEVEEVLMEENLTGWRGGQWEQSDLLQEEEEAAAIWPSWLQ